MQRKSFFGRIGEHLGDYIYLYMLPFIFTSIGATIYLSSKFENGIRDLRNTASIVDVTNGRYGFDDNKNEIIDRIEIRRYELGILCEAVPFKKTLRTGEKEFDTELARLEAEGKRR